VLFHGYTHTDHEDITYCFGPFRTWIEYIWRKLETVEIFHDGDISNVPVASWSKIEVLQVIERAFMPLYV
jgi:hypothetical protein